MKFCTSTSTIFTRSVSDGLLHLELFLKGKKINNVEDITRAETNIMKPKNADIFKNDIHALMSCGSAFILRAILINTNLFCFLVNQNKQIAFDSEKKVYGTFPRRKTFD